MRAFRWHDFDSTRAFLSCASFDYTVVIAYLQTTAVAVAVLRAHAHRRGAASVPYFMDYTLAISIWLLAIVVPIVLGVAGGESLPAIRFEGGGLTLFTVAGAALLLRSATAIFGALWFAAITRGYIAPNPAPREGMPYLGPGIVLLVEIAFFFTWFGVVVRSYISLATLLPAVIAYGGSIAIRVYIARRTSNALPPPTGTELRKRRGFE